jgi:hypothetical protein
MGVNSMVDYAKSLYEQKLSKLEDAKKSSLESMPVAPVPDSSLPLDDNGNPIPVPIPEPVVPVLPDSVPQTNLLEVMAKGVEVNSELVKSVASIANNSIISSSSVQDSFKSLTQSVYDLASVNVSSTTVIADIMLSMLDVLQSRSMTVEEIEYKNLELSLLSDIKDSLSSFSFSFPDSVGVDIKSLNPIQEEYLQKELYKQDIEIPMREKQALNLDNEISLTNKKLESIEYDLTPISLDNMGDTIPSMKPIEMRALNNAVTAKYISDNNTLEYDSDDFDTAFDFPDISSIFDFAKKSDRLTDLRSSL